MEHDSQESLLAEAASALGGEEVFAAGTFTLEDMIGVAVVGATLCDTIGGAAGGPPGEPGVGLALRSVREMPGATTALRSEGTAVQLVVAVTAEHVHVLNRETNGRPPTIVETFDRSTCTIEVSHFGPSTFVRLTEPGADKDMELGATVLSGPDRRVMNLLTG